MAANLPPDDPPRGIVLTNVEWWKREIALKGTLYVKIGPLMGGGTGTEVRATYHPYFPDAPSNYERTFATLERARILLGLRGFERIDKL